MRHRIVIWLVGHLRDIKKFHSVLVHSCHSHEVCTPHTLEKCVKYSSTSHTYALRCPLCKFIVKSSG